MGEAPVSEPNDPVRRQRFYLYLRQQGLWPQYVTGVDPAKDMDAFKPWNPILNVTRDWPATLLLHGTADTDVPYERSVDMTSALSSMRVPNRLVTIPGGGHGFDRGVTSSDVLRPDSPPSVKACIDAVEFVTEHLRD